VTADSTGILAKTHVADIVQTVFYPPVPPIEGEQPLGVGSLRFKAGDPVGHLDRVFPLLPTFASDLANLLQTGPAGLQVGGQLRGGNQRATLASAMAFVDGREVSASRITLPLLVGGNAPRQRRKRLRCLARASVGSP
jgi:hypothetical protein